MKKTIFYFVFLFLMPSHIFAQDIFIDRNSGKEYLFLGSDNIFTDQKKWLDLETNTIVWFDKDFLREQSGVLTPEEFFQRTLGSGFVFTVSSETPHWLAKLTNNSIVIDNLQGKKEQASIEFNYVESPMDNVFLLCFTQKIDLFMVPL